MGNSYLLERMSPCTTQMSFSALKLYFRTSVRSTVFTVCFTVSLPPTASYNCPSVPIHSSISPPPKQRSPSAPSSAACDTGPVRPHRHRFHGLAGASGDGRTNYQNWEDRLRSEKVAGRSMSDQEPAGICTIVQTHPPSSGPPVRVT